jgi:hypothetical protein
MGVHVRWYDRDKTILHIQYEGQWTLDDFHAMLQESNEMTRQSRPFVAIGDFSLSSMIPNGLLSTGRRIEQSTPSHRLMLVLIQPNMLMNLLIRSVSRIYPRMFDNMHIASTFEEAVQMARARLMKEGS